MTSVAINSCVTISLTHPISFNSCNLQVGALCIGTQIGDSVGVVGFRTIYISIWMIWGEKAKAGTIIGAWQEQWIPPLGLYLTPLTALRQKEINENLCLFPKYMWKPNLIIYYMLRPVNAIEGIICAIAALEYLKQHDKKYFNPSQILVYFRQFRFKIGCTDCFRQ